MKTPKYRFLDSSEVKINSENFLFRKNVKDWYEKVLENPTVENSAVFYGQGGTGKTTLAKLIAQKTNKPLFICLYDQLKPHFIPTWIKGEEKFEALVKDIETGIWTNYEGNKVKTGAKEKGYILLIEWAEQTGDEFFLRNATRDLVSSGKNALFIFATDIKCGELNEKAPYLYKSKLNEVLFGFTPELFRQFLTQRENLTLPISYPNNSSPKYFKIFDLVEKFDIFQVREFAHFWKKAKASERLSEDKEIAEREIIALLEEFWFYKGISSLSSYSGSWVRPNIEDILLSRKLAEVEEKGKEVISSLKEAFSDINTALEEIEKKDRYEKLKEEINNSLDEKGKEKFEKLLEKAEKRNKKTEKNEDLDDLINELKEQILEKYENKEKLEEVCNLKTEKVLENQRIERIKSDYEKLYTEICGSLSVENKNRLDKLLKKIEDANIEDIQDKSSIKQEIEKKKEKLQSNQEISKLNEICEWKAQIVQLEKN